MIPCNDARVRNTCSADQLLLQKGVVYQETKTNGSNGKFAESYAFQETVCREVLEQFPQVICDFCGLVYENVVQS